MQGRSPHIIIPGAQITFPGGTPGIFLVGVCRSVQSKSWPYFRPKNVIFHTRFQTWPLINYVIITYTRTATKMISYGKEPKSVTAFDLFTFFRILRFHPIRSQLETVLDLWLVNVCMKECELIKGGHTFGLLAVKSNSNSHLSLSFILIWNWNDKYVHTLP